MGEVQRTAEESQAQTAMMAPRNDVMMGVAPQRLDQAIALATVMSKSSLVPKEFQGNPANVVIALQLAAEIGLTPMQGLNNIAVINGRPTLWGDAMLALVLRSPVCEYVSEPPVGNDLVATCMAKRKDSPEPVTRTFSKDDAVRAGLWDKQGPWKQYPRRMLQMRARAFALRDAFADVLRGISAREEVEDYEILPAGGDEPAPRAVLVPMPTRQSAAKTEPEPAAAETKPASDETTKASDETKPADTAAPAVASETTAAPADPATIKPLDYGDGQVVRILRVWRPNPQKAGHCVETSDGLAVAYDAKVVAALEEVAKSNAPVTLRYTRTTFQPAPVRIEGVVAVEPEKKPRGNGRRGPAKGLELPDAADIFGAGREPGQEG